MKGIDGCRWVGLEQRKREKSDVGAEIAQRDGGCPAL
jgi:hypothetical protein